MNITGLGYGYLSGFANYISGKVSGLAKSVNDFFTGSVAKTSEADIVALHDDDKPREKCGVFAYFSKDYKTDLGKQLYKGLLGIQHRGQGNCGLAFSNGKNLKPIVGPSVPKGEKKSFLVNEVFNEKNIEGITGNFGIAHTLYSTTGSTVQPITIGEGNKKISLAHNGNLSDLEPLKKFLEEKHIKYDGIESDSSMMAKAVQYFVAKENKSLELAVHEAARFFEGSYSLLVMDKEKIVVLRDPSANRPLVLAKVPKPDSKDFDFIVCSETSPLGFFDAEFMRDIAPGELLVIDKNSTEESLKQKPKVIFGNTAEGLCSLEYAYFAKPNHEVQYSNGSKSISEIRRELGMKAAEEFKARFPNAALDYVLPVPQSGVPAATGFAQELNKPINPALIKNFHRRTFIDNGENTKNKFSIVRDAVKGKRVALVDDSLIRGKTMEPVIAALRKAGAAKIHIISAFPQVRHPSLYGINIAKKEELIAEQFNGNQEKIAEKLGADSVTFIGLDKFKEVLGEKGKTVDTSILDGDYRIKNYTSTYVPPLVAD